MSLSWLVLLVGLYVICLWWIPRMKNDDQKILTILISFCGMVIGTYLLYVFPNVAEARREYHGSPIINELHSFEGRHFTPQAFVITENRILIYDRDNRVYALDGIKLENGLVPEKLTVSTNTTYIVYRKGDQLLFGKL